LACSVRASLQVVPGPGIGLEVVDMSMAAPYRCSVSTCAAGPAKPSGVLDMGRMRRRIRWVWSVGCSAAKVATI
jgi:hypothetical protein